MKLASRLVGLLVLVGMVGAAEATPVYYTFTGVIDSICDNNGGLCPGATSFDGASLGDPMSLTFMVDMSLPGTQRNLGVTTPIGGGTYYVDFIGGTPFLPMTGTGQDFEWNYGTTPTSVLVGSSISQRYNYVQLYELSFADITTWVIGDSGFYGQIYIEDLYGTGPSGLIGWVSSSNLTLASISDIAPVPEPGTVALLGAGLLGLVALRRRAA